MRTDRDRVILDLAELDLAGRSQGRDAQREPEAGEGGTWNRGAENVEGAFDRGVAEGRARNPFDEPLVLFEGAVPIEVDPGVDGGDVDSGAPAQVNVKPEGSPGVSGSTVTPSSSSIPVMSSAVAPAEGTTSVSKSVVGPDPDVAVLDVPGAVGRERRAVGVGRVAEVEVLSRGHPAAEQDQERQNADPTPGSGCGQHRCQS